MGPTDYYYLSDFCWLVASSENRKIPFIPNTSITSNTSNNFLDDILNYTAK
jgi:hypothetical protein